MLEFIEKTGEAVPGEINAGAYVLERSVLDLIPPGRAVSIEREVFPRLVGEGLSALLLDGYWMDIGTPERYLQASWDILEGRVETRVEPDRARAARRRRRRDRRRGRRRPPRRGRRRLPVGRGADGRRLGPARRLHRRRATRWCSGSILAPGAMVEPGAQLVDAVVGRDERVPRR